MPKIQNQITRKICIIIQSLVSRRQNHHSGYSSDREKHHTLLTLKRRKNVVFDVTNVEQYELRVRCEPSTPRRDAKTGELARSSRRRALPFLPNDCCSDHNRVCLPGPPCSSSREGVTHSEQVSRLARTLSYSKSSILAPNSSESRSPRPSSH